MTAPLSSMHLGGPRAATPWIFVCLFGFLFCAAFVSECLDYRRSEAPDLDPYVTRETLQEMGLDDYRVDTFSSDYDDTFVDESGYGFDAHGA